MFRKYKINYVYIFAIAPPNRLNQYQFYKMFALLMTLWCLASFIEILEVKGYLEMHISTSLTLVLIMLALLLNPLNVMYKTFRIELLYSFYHNLLAPFG